MDNGHPSLTPTPAQTRKLSLFSSDVHQDSFCILQTILGLFSHLCRLTDHFIHYTPHTPRDPVPARALKKSTLKYGTGILLLSFTLFRYSQIFI